MYLFRRFLRHSFGMIVKMSAHLSTDCQLSTASVTQAWRSRLSLLSSLRYLPDFEVWCSSTGWSWIDEFLQWYVYRGHAWRVGVFGVRPCRMREARESHDHRNMMCLLKLTTEIFWRHSAINTSISHLSQRNCSAEQLYCVTLPD